MDGASICSLLNAGALYLAVLVLFAHQQSSHLICSSPLTGPLFSPHFWATAIAHHTLWIFCWGRHLVGLSAFIHTRTCMHARTLCPPSPLYSPA